MGCNSGSFQLGRGILQPHLCRIGLAFHRDIFQIPSVATVNLYENICDGSDIQALQLHGVKTAFFELLVLNIAVKPEHARRAVCTENSQQNIVIRAAGAVQARLNPHIISSTCDGGKLNITFFNPLLCIKETAINFNILQIPATRIVERRNLDLFDLTYIFRSQGKAIQVAVFKSISVNIAVHIYVSCFIAVFSDNIEPNAYVRAGIVKRACLELDIIILKLAGPSFSPPDRFRSKPSIYVESQTVYFTVFYEHIIVILEIGVWILPA